MSGAVAKASPIGLRERLQQAIVEYYAAQGYSELAKAHALKALATIAGGELSMIRNEADRNLAVEDFAVEVARATSRALMLRRGRSGR